MIFGTVERMTSRLARAPPCSNARKLCFMSQVVYILWPNCVSSMWSESESDMQMNWILSNKINPYKSSITEYIYKSFVMNQEGCCWCWQFQSNLQNPETIYRLWTLDPLNTFRDGSVCKLLQRTKKCKNNSVRLPNLGFCIMETSRVHDVTLKRWPWVASLSIFSWGIYKNLKSLNTTS